MPKLLFPIFLVFLSSSGHAAQEETNDAALVEQSTSWWLNRVGKWKVKTELDWTMGSDNPQFIHLSSESHSTMVLNDQYLLTRTITDGLESLSLEGFRDDSKEFWALSIDSKRTPFTYVSGNEDESFHTTPHPDMVLEDPFNIYSRRENFIEQDVFQSRGYFRKKQFMTITATRKSNKAQDFLNIVEKSPTKLRRVNKSNQNIDPAENYIEEHDFLEKLVGNFKSSDKSLYMTSRRICSGRFLFVSIRDKKQKNNAISVSIIGVDSTRAVFQMLTVDSEKRSPTYYEGSIGADGMSLALKEVGGKSDKLPAIEFTWILNLAKGLELHTSQGESVEVITFNKT